MAEITKQDLEAVLKSAEKVAKKTVKDELKAASAEVAQDAFKYLKTSENLGVDKIVEAGVKIWNSNGFPKNLDAQSFVKNPKERDKHRIPFDQFVSAIETACSKLPQDEAYDNAGLPTNAGILIPQIISEVIKEPAEPLMIGESLLRRIRFTFGEQIVFPAVGSYSAADIPPGGEYPERTLDFGGYVTATIGKSGVKVRITEEMLRYSMFDVMSLHLRAGRRAMMRHKETKIFNMINAQGTTIYDNSGGTSLRGLTSGRDHAGIGNYTLTLDNLFTMYADLMNAGFIPDTLIMHPMGWLVFVLNETLRSFGFTNNGPLWGTWSGTPGQSPTFSPSNSGGYTSGGSTPSTTPSEMSNATLQGNVPTLFPAPLDIAVTPFQTFSATDQTTTITMCTRSELGFLVEDEPLVVESWDDPERDIRSTKYRERYAVAVDNEGDSIANAKSIKIDRGFDHQNAQITRDWGTGELPTITGTV